MSERWWRAYDGAVDDPKVQQLRPELFKVWFNICCIASQNDGVLPSVEDIAFKLRTTVKKAEGYIFELRDVVLIDSDDDGETLRPHNWDTRQYKSDVTDPTAAVRMKRYRKNRNGVTANTVTDTVTISERLRLPETDTESEKKEDFRGRKFKQGRAVLVDGRERH